MQERRDDLSAGDDGRLACSTVNYMAFAISSSGTRRSLRLISETCWPKPVPRLWDLRVHFTDASTAENPSHSCDECSSGRRLGQYRRHRRPF